MDITCMYLCPTRELERTTQTKSAILVANSHLCIEDLELHVCACLGNVSL